MRLGQRCFNLIKSANGQHVPVSHLVAVTKAEWSDVMDVCCRLVEIGKASSRYERNGPLHEMHFWVEPKGKR